MTHDEMVEVVLAHKVGKRIEKRLKSSCQDKWIACDNAVYVWNFIDWDFRIAEPKWRDAVIDDLRRLPLKCRWRNFDEEAWSDGLLEGYVYDRPCWWIVGGHRCRQCQVLDK